MEKKYQVFISSTYKDLIEARSKVRKKENSSMVLHDFYLAVLCIKLCLQISMAEPITRELE